MCWTCVFVPKPPFRKFDFQKTCFLNESGEHCVLDIRFCPETAFPKIRFPKNMCDVRFYHKIMGCSHVFLFYNDLRKTSPWLHKNATFPHRNLRAETQMCFECKKARARNYEATIMCFEVKERNAWYSRICWNPAIQSRGKANRLGVRSAS